MDIKICGLKTRDAVEAVIAGGASHAGFIFFEKSPRNVEPETAGKLAKSVREAGIVPVAVTVDADNGTLDRIVEVMKPGILQLHGKETPERLAAVKTRYGLPVMKALAIREAADLDRIAQYRGIADRFLFDAKPPPGAELPGGNGVPFDWRLLSGLDPDIDYMLSGGLNADNIRSALMLLQPSGIDISSGVESAPGDKDPALIDAFFRSIRHPANDNVA